MLVVGRSAQPWGRCASRGAVSAKDELSHRAEGTGLRAPGSGHLTAGAGHQAPGTGHQALGTGTCRRAPGAGGKC
eukprot:2566689-Alexandrium_andersonii.AAC.1